MATWRYIDVTSVGKTVAYFRCDRCLIGLIGFNAPDPTALQVTKKELKVPFKNQWSHHSLSRLQQY